MIGITIENTTYNFTSLDSARELAAMELPNDATAFWIALVLAARELVAFFDGLN